MAQGRFVDRVAVVTGAGSGIGQTTARAFGREGARVVAVDVDPTSAQETAAMIVGEGGTAFAVRADVGESREVSAMVDAAVERFGTIDVLHNNAGIGGFTGQPMAELDEDTFDAVIRVNLKGVWLGMRHAIPVMLRNGGGCIVNTASTLGWVGQRFSGPYSASKHGVIGLTKSAAIEYGLQGIRINAVCPGSTETPIMSTYKASFSPEEWTQRTEASFPASGRLGRAEEVAAVVLFLCSDDASNIHGTALPVDGGYLAR